MRYTSRYAPANRATPPIARKPPANATNTLVPAGTGWHSKKQTSSTVKAQMNNGIAAKYGDGLLPWVAQEPKAQIRVDMEVVVTVRQNGSG